MTRICVFSDSHGCVEYMLRAIAHEKPDMIIHLGDGENDLYSVQRLYPELPVESVQGNCDRFSSALTVLNTTVAGKRIFAVHGHKYGVKYDPALTNLRYAAMEADADIVLFGHTHTPYRDHSLAMDILNPGSCGDVRVPTYGVIEIDGSSVSTAVKEVP